MGRILLILGAAFALTLAVEMPIAYFFMGGRSRLYPVFLCNLLTNPALNVTLLLLVRFWGADVYYPALIVLELSVVFIEAAVLRRLCDLSTKRALAMSLALNAASYIAGALL